MRLVSTVRGQEIMGFHFGLLFRIRTVGGCCGSGDPRALPFRVSHFAFCTAGRRWRLEHRFARSRRYLGVAAATPYHERRARLRIADWGWWRSGGQIFDCDNGSLCLPTGIATRVCRWPAPFIVARGNERQSIRGARQEATHCRWQPRPNQFHLSSSKIRMADCRLLIATRESQRDSDPKPGVARHELLWVIVRKTFPTAKWLRPIPVHPSTRHLPQPRCGCNNCSTVTQGRRWARQPWAEADAPLGHPERLCLNRFSAAEAHGPRTFTPFTSGKGEGSHAPSVFSVTYCADPGGHEVPGAKAMHKETRRFGELIGLV